MILDKVQLSSVESKLQFQQYFSLGQNMPASFTSCIEVATYLQRTGYDIKYWL